MSRRVQLQGEVGLADAIIAVEGLRAEDLPTARAWLAELIGLELPVDDLVQAADESGGPGAPKRSSPLETVLHVFAEEREKKKSRAPREREEARDPHRYAPTLPYELQWQTTEDEEPEPDAESPESSARPGEKWRDAPVLPSPKPLNFDDLPPLQPLFEERRNRSVLSGALSTSQPDGDPDLDALIEHVTRCEPLVELPRLLTPTTRLGLQLLIDRGRSLLPYHRDQDLLLHEIEILAGRDRVQVFSFANCPGAGVAEGPEGDPTARYRPPAPGVPVVLLTDLGIGRGRRFQAGAGVKEWLRFVRLVRAAGCPLLAIVPARPSRVPARLRREFKVLPWNHTTTIATVRSLIGRGLHSGS